MTPTTQGMDPRLHSWPEMPLSVVIGAGAMGLVVAKRLGQHSRLLIADINEEKLDSVKSDLDSEGYFFNTLRVDVTVETSVSELAKFIEQAGGFDSLVHVVGLSPSMADWKTIMSVNLIGPALMAKNLLPLAKEGSAGVFVASLAGHVATFTKAVERLLAEPLASNLISELETELGSELNPILSYLLSKRALIDMCQRLAPAWGKKKARIMTISPGLIATPMGDLEFKNQPAKYDLLEKTPLKRQGNMHEICDAIEFLLSAKASFISGTDLLVDGGTNAALKFDK